MTTQLTALPKLYGMAEILCIASKAALIDDLDGLSMFFEAWRFNLRKSNTEPLVRLNVETKGDNILLNERTEELKNLIKQA